MTDKNYITINSYKRSEYGNLFCVEKENLPKSEIESIEVWYLMINEKDQPFYKYNLTNGENRIEFMKSNELKKSKYGINKLHPDRPRSYKQYLYTISNKGNEVWHDVGGLDLNFDLIKFETDILKTSGKNKLLLRKVIMKSGNVYYYRLSKD